MCQFPPVEIQLLTVIVSSRAMAKYLIGERLLVAKTVIWGLATLLSTLICSLKETAAECLEHPSLNNTPKEVVCRVDRACNSHGKERGTRRNEFQRLTKPTSTNYSRQYLLTAYTSTSHFGAFTDDLFQGQTESRLSASHISLSLLHSILLSIRFNVAP